MLNILLSIIASLITGCTATIPAIDTDLYCDTHSYYNDQMQTANYLVCRESFKNQESSHVE